MNVIERTFAYLMDGSNWQGSGGILVRLLEHLSVTALATACAALIVVPLGLWAGHHRPGYGTNRGRSNLLMSAVAATRARSAHHPGALAGRLNPARPHRAHYYCGGTPARRSS